MISYKRERQSLSEVKMGRGSPICERVHEMIVKYFKNVKLQRLCKSHHLQCTTSSIDSEKLDKSLHKGQGRRPLLNTRGLQALRRHCITHQHDSIIDITKWAQEYFQKPLLVNTICRAIFRCQLKLYHTKRKPFVNMVQKCRCALWAEAHLKWTVSKWKSALWSDETKFDILVGNHRCCVRAKEEVDPSSMLSPFSSKARISDGMGVHKCISYGQLACFGRHYEC